MTSVAPWSGEENGQLKKEEEKKNISKTMSRCYLPYKNTKNKTLQGAHI